MELTGLTFLGAGSGLMDWFTGLAEFRLASCLALSAALFAIGAWGVLARRNVLLMLICVEVMLNAVMLALISFSRAYVNLDSGGTTGESGQIFALFIIAVAAAEAAVGLAIVVAFFRNRQTVDTREIQSMQG